MVQPWLTMQSKFGERAFSHAGPVAWNRLPETIRQAQTQTRFKKLLKTFLFTEFLSLFLTVMSAVLVFVSGHKTFVDADDDADADDADDDDDDDDMVKQYCQPIVNHG